ncbi:MAG: quinone-dependent dihydroorotate dehydrogenase [Solirubrobacterales bacterium]
MSSSETPRPPLPIYETFFQQVLLRLDSEFAHDLAERALRFLTRIPGMLALTNWILRPKDSALRIEAFGLAFRTPLGVAAGMDKNATWFNSLAALGFGAVEVGTVTARPQPGNEERPRMSRLPADRALLNALGFPSDGAEAVAARLNRRHTDAVIGVNIGKSRQVKIDDAVTDYRKSIHLLAPLADYLVLNVSSPNTPGLTAMQNVDRLGELINGVRLELCDCLGSRQVPLLIKLGPDLLDEEIERIANMALQMELDGIVAVNTTADPSAAIHSQVCLAKQGHGGGLSGRPLQKRALEVLRLLHAKVGGQIDLISVGGLESAADAWERILAGASLVQTHTAFVYGGPLWPHRFNRDLLRCLRESQWSSIAEAVGKSANGKDFLASEDASKAITQTGKVPLRYGATI